MSLIDKLGDLIDNTFSPKPIQYETEPIAISKLVFDDRHSLYVKVEDAESIRTHGSGVQFRRQIQTYGRMSFPLTQRDATMTIVDPSGYRTLWEKKAKLDIQVSTIRYIVDLQRTEDLYLGVIKEADVA